MRNIILSLLIFCFSAASVLAVSRSADDWYGQLSVVDPLKYYFAVIDNPEIGKREAFKGIYSTGVSDKRGMDAFLGQYCGTEGQRFLSLGAKVGEEGYISVSIQMGRSPAELRLYPNGEVSVVISYDGIDYVISPGVVEVGEYHSCSFKKNTGEEFFIVAYVASIRQPTDEELDELFGIEGVLDTDGDDIPDDEDDDDDNDGIPDDEDPDKDGDGKPNGVDDDVDGDGKPNSEDDDIDGDGIPNHEDDDIDGDGLPNEGDYDDDADGIPDSQDDDDDNDGTPDGEDGQDGEDGNDGEDGEDGEDAEPFKGPIVMDIENNPGGFEVPIFQPPSLPVPTFDLPQLPDLNFDDDFSFEEEVEPFEGKEVPQDNSEYKSDDFEQYGFGEDEGNEVEKSELKYFNRTGDWTISLKFDAVFNDLLEAVGTYLPSDFAKQFYEVTQTGVTAAQLPLKFGFNYTLFEGEPYAISVRIPEFNLATYFESARELPVVNVMRALLLALVCLYFVLNMFELVFKI